MILYDLEKLVYDESGNGEQVVRLVDNTGSEEVIKRVYFDLDFNFKDVEVMDEEGDWEPSEISNDLVELVTVLVKQNVEFLSNHKNELEITYHKDVSLVKEPPARRPNILDMTANEFKDMVDEFLENPPVDKEHMTLLEYLEELLNVPMGMLGIPTGDESTNYAYSLFLQFNDGLYGIPYYIIVSDFEADEINFQFNWMRKADSSHIDLIKEYLQIGKDTVSYFETLLENVSQ